MDRIFTDCFKWLCAYNRQVFYIPYGEVSTLTFVQRHSFSFDKLFPKVSERVLNVSFAFILVSQTRRNVCLCVCALAYV